MELEYFKDTIHDNLGYSHPDAHNSIRFGRFRRRSFRMDPQAECYYTACQHYFYFGFPPQSVGSPPRDLSEGPSMKTNNERNHSIRRPAHFAGDRGDHVPPPIPCFLIISINSSKSSSPSPSWSTSATILSISSRSMPSASSTFLH